MQNDDSCLILNEWEGGHDLYTQAHTWSQTAGSQEGGRNGDGTQPPAPQLMPRRWWRVHLWPRSPPSPWLQMKNNEDDCQKVVWLEFAKARRF